MYPTLHYELANARIADLHRQAERDRIARTARLVRKARSSHFVPGDLWPLPFWLCSSTAPGWRARCTPLLPEPTAALAGPQSQQLSAARPGHGHPGSINVWVPVPHNRTRAETCKINGEAIRTTHRTGAAATRVAPRMRCLPVHRNS